jgi:endonuclease/exonuclease/phosphatase family metal-dependent hydrolase
MRRTGVVVLALALAATACSSGSGTSGSGGGTTTATIRVVTQNLLHGTACAPDTNRCDLPDRVHLFVDQLVDAHCPAIVAIEEANARTVEQLRRDVPGSCGYHLVWDDDPSQDRELVLTTSPVLASGRHRLAGPLRTAYWVRVATDSGPVDLVATHLASSSDDRPCDPSTCPPPCVPADTLNACQGREAVALLRRVTGAHSVGVLAGDLNAKPTEPTIAVVRAAGLVDTLLAAGNRECDPRTGHDCTSGRIDDSLVDMRNAASKQSERIDYVFLRPTTRCVITKPTGVFAERGGPLSDRNHGLVFPADHNAVEATLRCRATAADRAAARPSRTTTTTRPAVRTVPPAVRAAVTAAFDGLFAPNPDPDAQLAHLEGAAALRRSFLARRAQVGDLANHTSVRIDSFDGATTATVDVTFTILLNGAVVLDALPGQAKLVEGAWLVSTRTYCQVATLGVDTIPEACRATP